MLKSTRFIGFFLMVFSVSSLASNTVHLKEGRYVYTQIGEELIGGQKASISWAFNIHKDGNVTVDISSWHAPFTCGGKYKIVKAGDEFNLFWVESENEGIYCGTPSPQFSIRQASNGNWLIKSELFPWGDNNWKKLKKIHADNH